MSTLGNTVKDAWDGSQYAAEEAQQNYADRFVNPDTPQWEKPFDFVGGSLASLWTHCNSSLTLQTIAAAGALDAYLVQPLKAAARPEWLSWGQYPKVTINRREYAQVGSRLYP